MAYQHPHQVPTPTASCPPTHLCDRVAGRKVLRTDGNLDRVAQEVSGQLAAEEARGRGWVVGEQWVR